MLLNRGSAGVVQWFRPNADETHLDGAWNYFRVTRLQYCFGSSTLVCWGTSPKDPHVFQLAGYVQRFQGAGRGRTEFECAVDLEPSQAKPKECDPSCDKIGRAHV